MLVSRRESRPEFLDPDLHEGSLRLKEEKAPGYPDLRLDLVSPYD